MAYTSHTANARYASRFISTGDRFELRGHFEYLTTAQYSTYFVLGAIVVVLIVVPCVMSIILPLVLLS